MMVLWLTNSVLSDMCYSLQKHVDRCVACPTGSKEFSIHHFKILNQSSEEEVQIGQQRYVCKIIAKEPPYRGEIRFCIYLTCMTITKNYGDICNKVRR